MQKENNVFAGWVPVTFCLDSLLFSAGISPIGPSLLYVCDNEG